jgi:hypothetical protein
MTDQQALASLIDRKEFSHAEMVGLMRRIMNGDMPPAVLSALRAATGRALPVAPATAEMLAGIVDSDQSMTLVDVGRDERRGPWRVPRDTGRRGPWFDSGSPANDQ